MNFDWTDEQLEFRDAVTRFANLELGGGDHSGEFFAEAWRQCGAFGIQGLPVAEKYGGAGVGYLTVVAALEALGHYCSDNGLIFALNAHMWACQYPIERFGTEEQKDRYLPPMCGGSLIGAHAMSEPDSGSDSFALTTTATPHGEGYRLRGSKTFVTNAPVADLFVVFARAPGTTRFAGLSAFLVERSTPGLEVGKPTEKMGLHTASMAEVFLDDCQVPAASLLGRPGRGMAVFTAAMEHERAMILASTIGAMERSLEGAVSHARERRQYGQPIGKFQAVSHRLVEMKLRLETATLLLHRVAWLMDHGRPFGLESALVKLHLSESFVASSLDALQVHGGYGYMVEYGLERDVRDALASRLYSGTSEIQRNLVARHMGL